MYIYIYIYTYIHIYILTLPPHPLLHQSLQVAVEKFKDLFTQLIGIYMFKVNNRKTRTKSEICSKLKIKTTERR